MAVESSKFFLVKIGDGESPTEAYFDLGTQANGRLGLNAQRIDTTNKTTGAYRSGIAGQREFVVDADGFANWPDLNGLDRLMSEALAGNDFSSRVVTNSLGDNFQATVQATNLELNGAANNATQWSTTWELSQGTPLQDVSP